MRVSFDVAPQLVAMVLRSVTLALGKTVMHHSQKQKFVMALIMIAMAKSMRVATV